MSNYLQGIKNAIDSSYCFVVGQYDKFQTVSSGIYRDEVATKGPNGLAQPMTRRQFVSDFAKNLWPLTKANAMTVRAALMTACTLGRNANWKAKLAKHFDRAATYSASNLIDVIGVITPGRVNKWLGLNS